MRWTDIKHY